MTIIVFLVDTSASMQQRTFVSGRSTLLDVAKGAVEFFVKLRQKSPESRGDRYMLLTFEEYPKNIKAGWKENLPTFMNELKNLEACGMTTMGTALKQVFDILNINRMQTGIDMYGQGRYPYYLEPAVIIVISDGGKLTTQGSVQSELNLPMYSSVPGAELTREPFRWDQRLYALVLRMAGTPPMSQEVGHVANDFSPIDAMCEVTGGRSYAVTSQRVLHQCIDSLVQKLQSGVVIHFEKVGPDPAPIREGDHTPDEDCTMSRADTLPLDDLKEEDILNAKGLVFNKESTGGTTGGSTPSRPHTPNPILAPSNTAWHNCRRLIFVPRSAQKGFAVGFWPIPEAFWPDNNSPTLPQRSAHPNVKFTCSNLEPMIIDNLPFDKYELEPSPLTQYVLARKQPKVCWQVYIPGSSKSSGGSSEPPIHPFGYLKASTNLMTVNLFVLPYNYPQLLPLLDELFKVHRTKPTTEWRTNFQNYLRTMPAYYSGPLRRVLTRMGAGNLASTLIPESTDSYLSYSVMSYLKRLKNQAKIEYDKVLNSTPVTKARVLPDGIKVLPRSSFKKELLTSHLLKDKFVSLRDQLTDFPGFSLGLKEQGLKVDRFRNPFDIPRNSLLDQIIRMRANFLQSSLSNTKLIEEDSKHSLPIAQMGNYQEYIKKMPDPLREIESTPVRQHMFGNPFKINKNMIMDEVVMDEVSLAGQTGFVGAGNENKTVVAAGQGGAALTRGIKRLASEPGLASSNPSKRLKKGPLPKDFVYRRNSICSISQNALDIESALPCPTTPPASESLSSMVLPLLTPPQSPFVPATLATPILINGASNCNEVTDSSVNDNSKDEGKERRVEIEPPNAVIVKVIDPSCLPRPDSFLNDHVNIISGTLSVSPVKRSPSPPLTVAGANHAAPVASSSPPTPPPPPPPQPPPQTGSGSNSSNGTTAPAAVPVSPPAASNAEHIERVAAPAIVNAPAIKKEELTDQPCMNGTKRWIREPSSARAPLLPSVKLNAKPDVVVIVKDEKDADEHKAAVLEQRLSEDELRLVSIRNQNMRQMISKEVKRPGRNHQKLLAMLKDLHGPPSIRRAYIVEVIAEAVRFKRLTLAHLLEQTMDQLICTSL